MMKPTRERKLLLAVLKAAKELLLNLQDVEEDRKENGKEYDDCKKLRKAIAKYEH